MPKARAASKTPPGAGDADQLELEFVRFGPRDRALDLRVDLGADTIWATQAQMAELFGVGPAAVSRELATLKGEGLGAVRPGSAGAAISTTSTPSSASAIASVPPRRWRSGVGPGRRCGPRRSTATR